MKNIDVEKLLEGVDIVRVIEDAGVALKKQGAEFVACCPFHTEDTPSFSVSPAKQFYHCFGCGAHGNAVDFLVQYKGLGFREACRDLGAVVPDTTQAPLTTQTKPRAARTLWLPVLPAPPDAPPPPRAHVKRGLPEALWTYKDPDGRVLGYVYRFKRSGGGKEVLPLVWARHPNTGAQEWRWLAFPEPRPLYGQDRLAAHPSAVALMVEGEKCADAGDAGLLDLGFAVTTWPGGGKAVDKVDLSPIYGRMVVLWPDCDAKRVPLTLAEKRAIGDDEAALMAAQAAKPLLPEAEQPGVQAMEAVATVLLQNGCKVWRVSIPAPGEKPDGWDIADAIAEGLTGAALKDWIKAHLVPLTTASREAASPPSAAKAGAGRGGGSGRPPEDPPDADDWRAGLRLDRGKLVDSLTNVFDILNNHDAWGECVVFDEFAYRTIKRRAPPYGGDAGEWADCDDSQTVMWLDRAEGLVTTSAKVAEAVEVMARTHPFHPVREWLASLPAWDGIRRTPFWLHDYLGVDDSEYVRRVSCYYLRGMVARVMQPGCKFDFCLVLEGEQGKGKSTALRILAGDWFADTDLDLHNKDAMAGLSGVWLYEFPEMSSVSKAEASKQKSFLSRQSDKYRPAYGRRDIVAQRQVVFAGSINDWEWNKDPTGGRRFWPVECLGEIDIDGLSGIRALLFAEAYADFHAGLRFWPTKKEQKTLFDSEQLKREQADSLIDALHDWVFNQISPFSVAGAVADGLKLTPDKLTRDFTTRVGIALKKLGCNRIEKRNGIVRYWWTPPVKKAEEIPKANNAPNVDSAGEEDDAPPW